MRESSYDSYEKESIDSLDEHTPDSSTNMPMTRHSSASALNRNRDSQNFHTFDSSYSEDRNSSGAFRSSPDLPQGALSHRRYSSTDSMDGSLYSGQSAHSRQGSDSQDINYPTRRMSAQFPRKQSVSSDPLQFVKFKGAQELAHTAEVQMRVAAESKKGAELTRAKDDDADWQANLSTWKNRRKSQSERSYQLREELEQMEKEKEGDAASNLPAKTFSQMQEDRERRKSSGRKFYPIDDEEEDTLVSKISNRLESSPGQSQTSKPVAEVSAWSRDSDGDEDDQEVSRHTSNRDNRYSRSKYDDQNDSNNNYNNSRSNDEAPSWGASSSSSRSKLSEKFRAFDDDENDTNFNKASTNTSGRTRRFGVPDHAMGSDSKSSDNAALHRSGENFFSKEEAKSDSNGDIQMRHKDSTRGDIVNRRSETFNKTKDMFNKSDSASEKDSNNTKLTTTRNVGSRTQSKIGSIMKNFEAAESKQSAPKQGYNEKINLSARKSAFENASQDNATSRVPPKHSNGADDDDVGDDSADSEIFDGTDDSEIISRSSNNSVSSAPRQPAVAASTPSSISVSVVHPTFSSVPSSSSSFSSSAQSKPVYASGRDTGKDFVEKTIKISQKANSDKGFGFFLTGGADKDAPLTVSKVSLGSAADICDLKVKDVVVMVNQVDVSSKTAMEVGDMVAKAVGTGFIELRIKRELGDDELDEEDFSSSSDEGEADLASPGHKGAPKMVEDEEVEEEDVDYGHSSVLNQLAAEKEWLEKQIGSKEVKEAEDKIEAQKTTVTLMPARQPETDAGNRMEVENRHTITVARHRPGHDDTARHSPSSSAAQEDDSSGSAGPPDVLRKWQRQRHKDEYTFETGDDSSETIRKISLNTSYAPLSSDIRGREDQAQTSGSAAAWDARMDSWTRQQDKERMPGADYSDIIQERFAEDQAKMRDKYDSDMKKAEEREKERKRQEEEMLQPQLDKAQVLEERRAERRARIFQSAAAATSATPRQEETSAPAAMHTTSMTLNLTRQPQQQQEQTPSFYSSGRPNTFVIDPRNRQGPGISAAGPVEFQVNLGKQTSTGQNTTALLEAERERIRQEELRKIEEERQRLEEERRMREEEETRKMKEKEEQLKREMEKLKLEKEKFMKEREEFERQQQQQQQSYKPPPQQHQAISARDHNQRQPPPNQRDQSSISSSLNRSHSPQQSNRQTYLSNSHPNSAFPSARRGYSQDQNTSTPSGYRSQQQEQPVRSDFPKQSSKSSSLPRWPPPPENNSNDNTNEDSEISRGGRRFSREEMLAMNKKATPLQNMPPVPQDSEIQPYQQQQSSGPITREAPSRGEIHSLNSAPRAKLRNDSEWYGSGGSGPSNANTSSRQAEQQRYQAPWQSKWDSDAAKNAGLGDHWLVQEAERRRIADSEGRLHPGSQRPAPSSNQFSGPIRPASDSPNRWRDNNGYNADPSQQRDAGRPSSNMSSAIRQTLLQKTSASRGSNDLAPPPMSSPQNSRSPSHSPSLHHQDRFYPQDTHNHSRSLSPRGQSPYQYQQQPHYQQPHQQRGRSVSPRRQSNKYAPPPSHATPPPGHAPPRPGENGMPVSGAQLCSHCDQELGFGAAMVIESLGLYYHVQCFRCCVCHTSLGSGVQGADVRVRVNKLHCPNCYSNDEAGLKFSKV